MFGAPILVDLSTTLFILFYLIPLCCSLLYEGIYFFKDIINDYRRFKKAKYDNKTFYTHLILDDLLWLLFFVCCPVINLLFFTYDTLPAIFLRVTDVIDCVYEKIYNLFKKDKSSE